MNSAFQLSLPAWGLMWILMLTLYLIGKGLMTWRLSQVTKNPAEIFTFLFFWVGMNPAEWKQRVVLPSRVLLRDATFGLGFLLAGICLLWGGIRHLPNPLFQTWVGLVAFVWIIHFGIFRWLAVFWQWKGRHVQAVMDRPLAATSLSQFWSQCWNRAFRDLMHPIVFAPIRSRWGSLAALYGTFFVSGLLHEIIFTFPAGAGYGKPLSYFLIQATGIALENKCQIFSRINRLYTACFVLLPIGLAFPRPFLLNVMHPFFQAIGALDG